MWPPLVEGQESDVRAQGHEVAVSEVGELEDAVDQRKANRPQRDDAAHDKADND